jgi:glycine/D-amino acid oxidase-like deaminating enzyme
MRGTADAVVVGGGVVGCAVAWALAREGLAVTLLAPITARMLADLMRGKALPTEAEALRPGRFS